MSSNFEFREFSSIFLSLWLISNFLADARYLHTNNEVVRKYAM